MTTSEQKAQARELLNWWSLTASKPYPSEDEHIAFEDRIADALSTARDEALEEAAVIAESHYNNHKGGVDGVIHRGQCHQAIATTIRAAKEKKDGMAVD